ncbi:LLM class flavin-dependent oxidoreductase [Streptomyces phaeofaciens JCM 4814]|uniref:Luciferase n=2 Tax=Streptomyces TaxID=1883 RepID=A0A918H456_9ACTN|nr:LLM class flavin-dependent oxidoreductase [Streptomyces phaeofaciens]AQW35068.1 oxidase [Streptomyces griseoruber]GGT36115.1 luciferase [Streptomyces phaeofaciens]
MEFGINFFPTVGPDDKPADQYFDEALRLAELAEELGYDHVKTVEHYFFEYGGYSPDPVTFLAAVAARTSRVKLVTGAVIPAFTHPVKLAGKLAMLDNISHGRLQVGFGRAFLPDEFDAFQLPMDESRPRFLDGLRACQKLWAEENVVWDSEFHSFGPVTLLPRPYQRPHPRILVAAAITPSSCEQAGRDGHGLLLVPSISKREKVQEMLTLYRKAYAEAGHPAGGDEVHLSYGCYLSEDPAEARTKGREYARRTNAVMVDAVAAWGTRRSEGYAGYESIVDKINKADFDKSLTENKTLVGSPEEVTERLRTIREWFGDVTISLQLISGNPTYEESARSARLFAEQVMPNFR